jgi:hypothetical protein
MSSGIVPRAEQEGRSSAADVFHNFAYPRGRNYINRLFMEFRTTDGKERFGKQPPLFELYHDWIQAKLNGMRDAFHAKGDEKHSFTSP